MLITTCGKSGMAVSSRTARSMQCECTGPLTRREDAYRSRTLLFYRTLVDNVSLWLVRFVQRRDSPPDSLFVLAHSTIRKSDKRSPRA